LQASLHFLITLLLYHERKNVHDLLLHSEIASKLAFPHYAFIIL
jgi:hypothetical protein